MDQLQIDLNHIRSLNLELQDLSVHGKHFGISLTDFGSKYWFEFDGKFVSINSVDNSTTISLNLDQIDSVEFNSRKSVGIYLKGLE